MVLRAAILIAAILASSVTAQAAVARSTNFIVTAPDQATADMVADSAEAWRTYHFANIFGHDPVRSWSKPAEITIQITGANSSGGGATSMAHHENGAVTDFTGTWLGSHQRLIEDVVPHEVFHTVVHSVHGKPVNRWLDEGWATSMESTAFRQEQLARFQTMYKQQRLFPTAQLHAMQEYPSDPNRMGEMYAQSLSQIEFIIARYGPDAVEKVRAADCSVTALGYPTPSAFEQDWLAWHESNPPLRQTAVAYRPGTRQCVNGQCSVTPGSWLYRDEQGRWVPFGRLLRGVPPRQGQPIQAPATTPPVETQPLDIGPFQPTITPPATQPIVAVPQPPQPAKSEAVATEAKPSSWSDSWWFKTILGVGGVALGGAAMASPQLRGALAVWRVLRTVRRARKARQQSRAWPEPDRTLKTDTAEVVTKVEGGQTGKPVTSFRLGANRDGTEAHELLQLLDMEGENPIHYAYVGLATFDELDRLLEGSNTPDDVKRWAGDLKRVLQDRINRTIPVTETIVAGV